MANTLAYHETLELHELVAFASNALVGLKMKVRDVPNQELKNLYLTTIKVLERYIKELLQYFPRAPQREEDEREQPEASFFAGNLLGLTKTLIRNYSIAITETATPVLKKTLTNQLNGMIDLHSQVFNYMYKNNMYPAYDLSALIKNDVNNANRAIAKKY
ncbi:spore coat protein [Bacillus sp. FJAT-27986]|uniref:spore coat protein n=1 Tax=Bacillus sp. FJAT-27986 TaxID=1743146 RepID=UPI00080ACB30|nr:spore coat protein [Bacillus sp. FJAT-27986]OCA89931.1 spore coat protein [Bacillus sp. FJAT-27986]